MLIGRREFLGSMAVSAVAQPSRTRPNVVVVITDDQGYGDLSSHGNPVLRTPSLDNLRESSVRLTNFHVAPMCTPTRGQLMTGRHALDNMAMNVSAGRALLRTDLPTMADLFAEAGYATGMFGKWHLGDNHPYRPQDRGFAESVWFPSSHVGSAPDFWNNDYFGDTYCHNGVRQKYEGYCTDVFFGEAMSWMRARHAEKQPFFTYLATNAPHGPLFVPEQYRVKAQTPELSRFFGMVANIDENVGRLMTMLRETGMDSNTIVVFLTDNGGTAGTRVFNAGLRGSKVQLWDGGHRVPCFVRWAGGGIKPGRDLGHLTQVQDLLPTLLDLCGIKTTSEFDGISLAGLLRGTMTTVPDRTLFVQFSRMFVGRPAWGDAAVLWNRWRLVGTDELYDVEADPAQTVNVLARNRAIAGRMLKAYDQWWRTVEQRLDTFLPVSLGAGDSVLLSPCEWADVSMDQSREVRLGVRRNGLWHVHVRRAGRYRFALSRWPRESGLAMNAAATAHTGECGSYPAGVVLPVAAAELRFGARVSRSVVQPGDREALFTLDLPEGRGVVRSAFLDTADKEICGAYYVYVSREAPR